MTMLFIMGVLLVFTALLLVASAVRNAAPSTGVARSIELIEAMTTAPSELKADLDKSFGERVMIPLQNRFAGLGRRLSGADSAERIHALVMVTRHAIPPIGVDAQVLVDADLSILGAPAARFQEYEAQVRLEYAWVPDATFHPARARILEELLGRPHLYSTARFRERYEAQARDNLRRSLAALQGGEPTPSAGENTTR